MGRRDASEGYPSCRITFGVISCAHDPELSLQGYALPRHRDGRDPTRKLAMLDAAKTLDFMRSPPGNRLEALRGDRAGQWSVRINDQWRLCFVWTDSGPDQVEIVDYH